MAHYYEETSDEGLKLIISAFFNDMKERSCRAEVIESISAAGNPSSKAMLVSSCWQSGLDYSEYAVALADEFHGRRLPDITRMLHCTRYLLRINKRQ
ncbi:MAG: hypothetical protein MZV63_00980 [Marinilabiliales bacterium]|nr:hypothetical protein [Marinilabiliales bacterium]